MTPLPVSINLYVLGMSHKFFQKYMYILLIRRSQADWFNFDNRSLFGHINLMPLSRMLRDILDDDHVQWHPPLIRHYTNFDPVTDLSLITEF